MNKESRKLNIDKLLDVFLEGIYAMDPKTALPFWDYDFAPLFGDLWIKKMIRAVDKTKELGMSAKTVSHFFENIAVPRKEIIYSLLDLKVGNVPKQNRLDYLNFWWDVVLEMSEGDYLVEKANLVYSKEEVARFMNDLDWEIADSSKARQVGNLSMQLNSLSYGLYTDIFAHNAMENFGAYDVSGYFSEKKHILVIKQWANLRPSELYPEFADFKYNKINVYAIYKDIDYTLDIYTHQIYHGNAADNLVQYVVIADGKVIDGQDKLIELNNYLGPIVVDHFKKIKQKGYEDAKKAWVLARNYQFKNFFNAVGLDWHDQKMLDRVKDKKLERNDFWDFDKYPKGILFRFWRKCFDPRLDTYYSEWQKILNQTIRKCGGRDD